MSENKKLETMNNENFDKVVGGTGPWAPENDPNADPEGDRKANEEFLNGLPNDGPDLRNWDGKSKLWQQPRPSIVKLDK